MIVGVRLGEGVAAGVDGEVAVAGTGDAVVVPAPLVGCVAGSGVVTAGAAPVLLSPVDEFATAKPTTSPTARTSAATPTPSTMNGVLDSCSLMVFSAIG